MCSYSVAEEYSPDSERSTVKTSRFLMNSIFAVETETSYAKRKSSTATCWSMNLKAARLTKMLKENFWFLKQEKSLDSHLYLPIYEYL